MFMRLNGETEFSGLFFVNLEHARYTVDVNGGSLDIVTLCNFLSSHLRICHSCMRDFVAQQNFTRKYLLDKPDCGRCGHSNNKSKKDLPIPPKRQSCCYKSGADYLLFDTRSMPVLLLLLPMEPQMERRFEQTISPHPAACLHFANGLSLPKLHHAFAG